MPRPADISFLQKNRGVDSLSWDQLSLEQQHALNARLDRVNKFISDQANDKEGLINKLCFLFFRQVSPIQVFLTDAPPYPDGEFAIIVQRIVARLMEKVENSPPILEDFRQLREWEPSLQIGIIPTLSRKKRSKPRDVGWEIDEIDAAILASCGISGADPFPKTAVA